MALFGGENGALVPSFLRTKIPFLTPWRHSRLLHVLEHLRAREGESARGEREGEGGREDDKHSM